MAAIIFQNVLPWLKETILRIPARPARLILCLHKLLRGCHRLQVGRNLNYFYVLRINCSAYAFAVGSQANPIIPMGGGSPIGTAS